LAEQAEADLAVVRLASDPHANDMRSWRLAKRIDQSVNGGRRERGIWARRRPLR
jgi:hypothetical protein